MKDARRTYLLQQCRDLRASAAAAADNLTEDTTADAVALALRDLDTLAGVVADLVAETAYATPIEAPSRVGFLRRLLGRHD
jgi:hypothetical protein